MSAQTNAVFRGLPSYEHVHDADKSLITVKTKPELETRLLSLSGPEHC